MKAASAKNIRHAGIFLTLSALVTAPFDELLIIEMGPMTMRLAQLLIMAASAVLLWVWFAEKKVLLPYGWLELSLLLLLNFAFCFVTQSESLVFQLGYQVWFALDIALVVLCVNFFRTQEERDLLLKTYIFVFALMAVVCIFQIFVGLFGVSFYTDQAFGDLPRADAFLSEPSYYACFALPGWVFLSFLLENGIEPVFTGRWLRAIWCAVTVSLIFSSSAATASSLPRSGQAPDTGQSGFSSFNAARALSTVSCLEPNSTTAAPFSRNFLTVANPIPLVPPVITATFPFNI